MTKRCNVATLGSVLVGALSMVAWPATASGAGADEPRVVRAEGSGTSTARPRPARLIREGAFLADRQGWVRPVGAMRWAMVFDKAEDGTVDAPMALLPSLKLMEMRRIVEARPETVTFRVSGRVFVFKGRNYLLPTFFVTMAQAGEPPAGVSELSRESASEARQAFDDLLGKDPEDQNDPEAMLRRVDKATPTQTVPSPAAVTDQSADGQTAPGGEAALPGGGADRLVREGTMIVGRRGRLVRGPAGELVFAVDNGAGAEGPASLRLLPCLNLQEMERLSRAHPVPLQFKVSGEVFVYDGQNFLLPTMYLIEIDREGNLVPGQ